MNYTLFSIVACVYMSVVMCIMVRKEHLDPKRRPENASPFEYNSAYIFMYVALLTIGFIAVSYQFQPPEFFRTLFGQIINVVVPTWGLVGCALYYSRNKTFFGLLTGVFFALNCLYTIYMAFDQNLQHLKA